MTDKHAAYVVVLGDDIREDDAEQIITALRMVRGVVDVRPVVADVDLRIAETRVRAELRGRILDAVARAFEEQP